MRDPTGGIVSSVSTLASRALRSAVWRLGYGKFQEQRSLRRIYSLPSPMEDYRFMVRRSEELQFVNPSFPYEQKCVAALCRIVQPGWVCVDAGAHIGYMALLMAKLVGEEGRVFAFEALPENARLIRTNVALNRLEKRVTVENIALSDGAESEIVLYQGPSSFEASTVRQNSKAAVRVPARALDGYFAQGAHVDFIKMDIEGAEVTVVPGMTRLLAESRPLILLEVHRDGWPAVEVLHQIGYRLLDLDQNAVGLEESKRLTHLILAHSGAGR